MELISRRELARRTNLSETSIRDYIKAGKITTKSFASGIHGKGDLIYEIAFNELLQFRPSLNEIRIDESDNNVARSNQSDSSISVHQKMKENIENDEDISYADAERREKIAKAKIAELSLAEKQGILVNKADVDRALFTFGREIRDSILSVPDRTIDNILACDTRYEALLILNAELTKALTALSEMGERDVTGS